jgi:RNA polymerase sigma factor (sigma-70 family)
VNPVFFLSGFRMGGCYGLNMTPDGELLGRYAETKSEEAFEELVRRHIDLVYSAALRQVNGDAALAQDVAQTVFANLAHKAAFLSRRPVLAGWLYTSTRFAAANSVRTEHRRRTREQEAQAMHELLDPPYPDPDWEKLRPLLDKVMHELKDADRTVILMRYFENGSFAEIGRKLGLSEEAARKRVDRALEKLRGFLFERGISTTVGLGSVLSAHASHAAPAGLAKSVAVAAVLKGAVAGGSTFTLLKGTLMAWTKAKLATVVGAGLILATGATIIVVKETKAGETASAAADGLPRTLEELNAWYAEPPAGQNAANYYLQGFNALQIRDANKEPNLPVVGGLTTMLTKQPEVMAATTVFVQNNQKALQMFAQAAQYDQSRYPVDFTRDALDGLHLTHLNNIKRGAQTVMVAAMLDAENQQGRPAADDVLLLFALTRSLKNEPVVISQLVRVAIMAMSLGALEQVVNRTTVPGASLSEMAQTLEALEKSDANGEGFNRSLIGERVMVMNHFKRSTIPDLVSAVADSTTDEQRQLFVKRLKRFGGIKAEQAYVEAAFQKFLSARKEPFPERLSNSKDVQQQASENPDGLLLLNNAWLTGYAGLEKAEAKCLANLRLARVAVALEQFRADRSRYPTALSQLTPVYLDVVPADPFDGQPLRYRPEGAGYILYSIGPDLKDDFGQRMKANVGDIVFAVATPPSA